MRLEDLVPPLDLCKRIPKGCFEDSAIVWIEECRTGDCELREVAFDLYEDADEFCFPAPTLQEIMEELKAAYPKCFWGENLYGHTGWFVQEFDCLPFYMKEDKKSPVTAALKLWLAMVTA